jgi:cytochrome c
MARLMFVVLTGALVGCGSDDSGGPLEGDGATPSGFEEQVELGGQLYGEHCATCHGDAGQGTVDAPALVGLEEGALPREPRANAVRTEPFVTVADVASFAVANMPPEAPGSLEESEYWAILAFALSANGITLDEALTPELAAELVIPR